MTDTTPMSGGLKATLIILGILFLLPGACGTLFFGAMLADWVANGFSISRGDLDLGPGVAGIGATSLVGSVIVLGIILRYSRWSAAPTLSLVLAIIAAATSVLAVAMLADRTGSSEDMTFLLASGLAGLVFGALPPYLFWSKNKNAPPETGS